MLGGVPVQKQVTAYGLGPARWRGRIRGLVLLGRGLGSEGRLGSVGLGSGAGESEADERGDGEWTRHPQKNDRQ